MLTHDELMEFYRQLHGEHVLSVYLNADQHDPAERNRWRTALSHQLDAIRKSLGADERKPFEEAVNRVHEELDGFEAFLPDRGFVAFATPDVLRYAETVPLPMPDLARWEPGIQAAPYVRALSSKRPVVLVLLDSRRARLFHYQDGVLDEAPGFRADTFVGDLSDAHAGKRPTTRSGVRGQTSSDAAHRYLEVSWARMARATVDAAVRLAGDHGFLVVGGTPERASMALDLMPKRLERRVEEASSMHVEMKDCELRAVLDGIASRMTSRYHEALLCQVRDQARAGGRACMGRKPTERALAEMRVDMLLITRELVEREPDYADRLVGAAFAGGARVEEVQGPVGETLERDGDGLACRLRFTVTAA